MLGSIHFPCIKTLAGTAFEALLYIPFSNSDGSPHRSAHGSLAPPPMKNPDLSKAWSPRVPGPAGPWLTWCPGLPCQGGWSPSPTLRQAERGTRDFPGTSLCQASLPQQLFPSESQGKGEVRAPPDLAGICTWCFLSLPTGLQVRSRCSATAVSHTGGNTRPPYCRLTLLIAFITFIYFLLTHSVFG